MLAMEDACFGYPPPDDAPAGTPPTVIVRNVSKSVMAGQRIGILGANGQGKSTVIKTIARDLGALSGTITEGKGLTCCPSSRRPRRSSRCSSGRPSTS